MNKIDLLARKAVFGAVALLAVMAATAARAESVHQVVQVVKVEGRAQYSTDGRTWKPLKEGDTLHAGSVIMTAEKSLVDVMLADEGTAAGSVGMVSTSGGGAADAGGGGGGDSEEATANIVRIFQSTVLGVDTLTVDRTGVDEKAETQLDLRAGQVMANVKKLSNQSHFEVKIPNGVAGIRGSCGLLSSSAKCATISGTIRLALEQADGSTQLYEVTAHHGFDPTANPPVFLISPKDWEAYLAIFRELSRLHHRPPFHFPHDPTREHDSNTDGSAIH